MNAAADAYLERILLRELVDTSATSPVRGVLITLDPHIRTWANQSLVNYFPSGSFAKGTAVRSGTDIDIFISLSEGITETLQEVYEKLYNKLVGLNFKPRKQNVSINITCNGHNVDLVPAKRQNPNTLDHSLYRSKAKTWTKTNVVKHIDVVRSSGLFKEIKCLKLWRNQNNIDFPSFLLELVTITAIGSRPLTLSEGVITTFNYIVNNFKTARIVDPANTANVISDDLTATEKQIVIDAARRALSARIWEDIIK